MIYFGIPSYQRAEQQLTLNYLERVGVKREQIIMSVQTAEDYSAYRAKGYHNRVAELLYRPARNVSGNTNTIFDALPKSEKIIILDDDIETISKLVNGKLVPISGEEEFSQFIDAGYAIANALGTIGFSVYPVHNEYYMSRSYNKAHIGEGTFLALTNVGIKFDPLFDTKSDYELTCRILRKYKYYPRMNMYACKAKHYSAGGCAENWKNKDRVFADTAALLALYPELVKPNKKRPGEVLQKTKGDRVNV